MLTVFDDMIGDMEANEILSYAVTELFLIGRKLNIALAFISQSYHEILKTKRLKVAHYCIVKIPDKRIFNK